MRAERPLTDRIVARAVSEGVRLAAASDSRKLSLTTRVVVARLEPFVRRAASRIARRVGSQGFADDVVQDALIVVATRLVQLERVSVVGLEAFAYGIARNRAWFITVRERRLCGVGAPRVAEDPWSAESGPVENAIRCDLIQSIRRAATGLRRCERRVTVMMLRGTDSRAEIARRLEISVDAAAMRKSRTLRALRTTVLSVRE
jgi:DNA-directed RNA polymerase specialized sigma24 family protein